MSETPTEHQRANLSLMLDILVSNSSSRQLARELWEFFNHELYCTIQPATGEASRFKILPPIDDVATVNSKPRVIMLSIRKSQRIEEALVHELLHGELIRRGYPVFFIHDEQDSRAWKYGAMIKNNAEHVVVKPIFLSLGYSEDRFTSPTKPLNDEEKRIIADLDPMDLSTPDKFRKAVDTYMAAHNIRAEPLQLPRSIFRPLHAN